MILRKSPEALPAGGAVEQIYRMLIKVLQFREQNRLYLIIRLIYALKIKLNMFYRQIKK